MIQSGIPTWWDWGATEPEPVGRSRAQAQAQARAGWSARASPAACPCLREHRARHRHADHTGRWGADCLEGGQAEASNVCSPLGGIC